MEIITSEDFELTEAIKAEIHEKVEAINSHLNGEATVQVFLSKDSSRLYNVKFLAHVFHQDVVSDAKAEDFHVCLNDAKAKILRQIMDIKNKHIDRRH
ncbi:MAG: HPF/RaiA family ribosome-associated protein [Bdellovibrionales bacterium]